MDDPKHALEAIRNVPEKFRRPYFRWTEADVLCALGRFEEARRVLVQSLERDTRSRHKTLIRLTKIEYLLGNHETAGVHAEAAGPDAAASTDRSENPAGKAARKF